MRVLCAVAGGAVGGSAFEELILVALRTRHRDVPARQREDRTVVVVCAGRPAIGGVTGGAVRSEFAAVRVVSEVAGGAVGGRAFEDASRVTGLASHRRVFTDQREGEFGVIHARQLPAFGRVAGGAVRPKLTVMAVVFQVTGGAILGRAFEDAVLVTGRTGHHAVFARQFKGGTIVVEGTRFPTAGTMAGGAVCAERALMGVVALVAGVTVLGRGFQVGQGTRANVALGAFGLGVLSAQLERDQVMVEGGTVRVHSVVACDAVCPEGEDVFLREGQVHLQVAVGADVLVEGLRVARGVTILAGEGRAVGFGFVRGEREAHAVVIEGGGLPAVGGVAGGALRSEAACMGVVLKVAGDAVLRCAFEDASRVTVFASDGSVFAGQREEEFGMIHARQFPALGGVTTGAVRSELTRVTVIVCVAGDAIHGRAFEDAIFMAVLACNRDMFADQLEGRQVVVKGRGFPTVGRVAGGTVCAEAPGMEVVFLVADVTVLRRGFQVGQVAGVDVTARAGRVRVATGQGKRDPVMVEGGTV